MAYIDDQANFWTTLRLQRDETGDIYAGPMATMEASEPFRDWLPGVLADLGITTMLDAPCGCWTWMQHVDLGTVKHQGWDVEPTIVERNQQNHGRDNVQFSQANLLTEVKIPEVDLILCRDFMMHLPDPQIVDLLEKFVASGSKYLLASNFPGSTEEFAHNPESDPLKGDARTFDLRNLLTGLVQELPEASHRTMDLYDLQANR